MMKLFILSLAMIITVLFTGCMQKMYVGVKSSKAATLQLIPNSKTDSDVLYAKITDYSKGCEDMDELGYISTYSDTVSKPVNVHADKPLLIQVSYYSTGFAADGPESTDFVLTPKKNKHYIIEYVKKKVRGFTETDFYVYMKNGKKAVEIPEKRLRNFNYRECM